LVKDTTPDSDVKEELVDPTEHLLHLDRYSKIESLVWNEQLELIESTFLPVISQHMSKVSISQRRVAVDNLFNFFKEMLLSQEKNKDKTQNQSQFQSDRLVLLERLVLRMAAEKENLPPDWLIAMFTIQILIYSKDQSVMNLSIASMFFALSARLKVQIQNMSSWVAFKMRPENYQ